MKRILFFIAVMALVVSCETFYPFDGTFQVSIKNETAYPIDAQLNDCGFYNVAPGTTSAAAIGTMEYYDIDTRAYIFYVSESGLPLTGRGKIYVYDKGVYVVRVYYDFYLQEYRYALE